MVTVTMEAEKETAVLKGKTALGLTIADGKGGLILNATWEGEHLEMDEAIAVLDCMIEKHVKDMFSDPKARITICAHMIGFLTDIQKEEISKLLKEKPSDRTICEDCGTVFKAKSKRAFLCPKCVKRRISESHKNKN